MNVAILGIFVGEEYRNCLFGDWYSSIKQYFLPDAHKDFYIWTDDVATIPKGPDIHVFHTEERGHPFVTLRRYDLFLNASQKLLEGSYTYVYFINADVYMKRPLAPSRLLLDLPSVPPLTACKHPGRYSDNPLHLYYISERNPESRAYFDSLSYTYVCGGFNGGQPESFVQMCKDLSEWTAQDLSKGILPIWNDETILNRYVDEHRDEFAILPNGVLVRDGEEGDMILRKKEEVFPSGPLYRYTQPHVPMAMGGFANNLWCLSAALKTLGKPILEIENSKIRDDFYDYFADSVVTFRRQGITFPPVYYQHKYFLVPKEKILPYVKIEDTECLKWACHIRLGDYLANADYARTIPSAARLMGLFDYLSLTPNQVTFITDSPEIFRRLYPKDWNVRSTNQDFSLLTNAENIIMSASTFSWWAAYLGNHKLIFYPSQWYCDFVRVDPTCAAKGTDLIFDRSRTIVY